MVNNVETAKDRVQEAILAAMENGETLRIELAVGSRNTSFEGYAGCVNTHSERGDWVGVNASLKKVCDKYYTFHELSMNAETRGYIPDKVSEFPFPRTHIDQQIQTHNSHKLLPNSIRPNTKYPNATMWYPKLKHRFYFSSILLLMPILFINLKELKKSQRLDFSCTQAFFFEKKLNFFNLTYNFFDKFRDILCHPKFEKMWKWPEKIYMDEIQCPNACKNPGRYFVEKFEEKKWGHHRREGLFLKERTIDIDAAMIKHWWIWCKHWKSLFFKKWYFLKHRCSFNISSKKFSESINFDWNIEDQGRLHSTILKKLMFH